MSKLLSLIALSPLFAAGGLVATVAPAQANSVICGPICATTYHQYNVPNPTRRGMFISHFTDNGAPQSIVTPSDSDTVCEWPLKEVMTYDN